MLSLQFTPFPVLQTERLLLRALSSADAPALAEMRSNKRVNEFLYRADSITVEYATDFIAKRIEDAENNESIMWAIQLRDEPRMLGSICLWNIVPEKDKAEIGYEMHPDYYGKGIMHEAMQKVIEYGFGVMKLKTMEALPVKDNLKSIQLLERNHFIRDLDIEKYELPEEERDITAVYILNR